MNKDAFPPSDCREIRPHLEAYLDGEIGDDSMVQCVRNHLGECSSCRAEVEALSAIRNQLRDIPALVVSKRLSESVKDVALNWTESERDRSGSLLPRRKVLILAMSSVAIMAIPSLGLWWWSAEDDEGERPSAAARGDLTAFVDDYVAYVQSDNAPVVETDDTDTMEGWLAARLDFAPKLPRWSWAKLISGRLCFIHGQRVARVQYSAEEIGLTLFVQPLAKNGLDGDEETRQMRPPKTQRLRGFEVACWRSSELDYVLVGPASAAELFNRLEIGGQEESEYRELSN